MTEPKRNEYRSRDWFMNRSRPYLSLLYTERLLNNGTTAHELQSGRPVIGIAQSGSDLAPCNRHHIQLAERLADGVRDAGGVPMQFPIHPFYESCRRPTAMLDRNLAYLGIVEVLHGYPLDGCILTTGCDKTTPASLMAAATTDLPSIVFSGGPMLNGWLDGKRIGSGTSFLAARKKAATGEISDDEYWSIVLSSTPSVGHCNTMGTALTMNSLAEALGMSLPGCAAIPGPHRERAEMAYRTGVAAVRAVEDDIRPSRIMTRTAFLNAIAVCAAIGGSSNAPVHLNAIARHVGVDLTMRDWQDTGYPVPLLADLQPAGQYLGEDFHRGGGIPAVLHELIAGGYVDGRAKTINRRTVAENVQGQEPDGVVIRRINNPVSSNAGFTVLGGNLFSSGVLKTSVISEDFRKRYLCNPDHPNVFVVKAVVFEGPEDYLARINDADLNISSESILIMRGIGPIGFPGAAEAVNMQPPDRLLEAGIDSLPCMGDGRQSGTSGSPSILNCSPEAAAGGMLSIVQTGDSVQIDLNERRVDLMIEDSEIEARRAALDAHGGFPVPASKTPWEELHRTYTTQLEDGMTLSIATKYHGVNNQLPRYNHPY